MIEDEIYEFFVIIKFSSLITVINNIFSEYFCNLVENFSQ